MRWNGTGRITVEAWLIFSCIEERNSVAGAMPNRVGESPNDARCEQIGVKWECDISLRDEMHSTCALFALKSLIVVLCVEPVGPPSDCLVTENRM